jgi:prepilin-type N-terminal cleavage/methylation domain-containing protein
MKFSRNNFYSAQSAFTMIEIAISLAVIGIALVAIIGVLPIGMNVQKDTREETVIDQDATVFIEALRSGASSPFGTDLTNYVYAITNFQTLYNPSGNAVVPTPGWGGSYLTNNARILGLLGTPEYTNPNNNAPIDNLSLFTGSYNSNHVVAYVHSISGPAVEKPPQDNQILQQDSFGYKIIFDNVPVAVNTPPVWQPRPYNIGDEVLNNGISWRAIVAGQPLLPPQSSDTPGSSPRWAQDFYIQQLTANLHELRLTFLWPLLPSGNTGAGRQTFRTMVGGQITFTNDTSVTPHQPLYFFQSQSFTNAP